MPEDFHVFQSFVEITQVKQVDTVDTTRFFVERTRYSSAREQPVVVARETRIRPISCKVTLMAAAGILVWEAKCLA